MNRAQWRVASGEWRVDAFRIPHFAFRNHTRGVTLMELLVASTISLVVILAVGQIDVSRILLSQQARQTSTLGSEAQLAMLQFVRDAQQADRINVLGPTNVQLRIPAGNCTPATGVPDPGCFDVAANYRWVQYTFVSPEIRFYDNTAGGNCGVDRTFHDISGFVVEYLPVAQAPPGGDPLVQDNNVLRVQVTTANAQAAPMTYEDTVTIRAGAYTNLNATSGGDSGRGLDATNVSPPPGACQ